MDGDLQKELCPAPFKSMYYLRLIGLYLLGAFLHGSAERKLGWTPRNFAPIVVVVVVAYLCIQWADMVQDYKYDLYLLAPIFGITGSVSTKSGLGGVPWAATGNMLNIAYHAASYFDGAKESDAIRCVTSFCLWASMVAGVILGTVFHGEMTLVLLTLFLAVLFCLMSSYLPHPRPDSPQSSETLGQQATALTDGQQQSLERQVPRQEQQSLVTSSAQEP